VKYRENRRRRPGIPPVVAGQVAEAAEQLAAERKRVKESAK
jgi:hypothetical protein